MNRRQFIEGVMFENITRFGKPGNADSPDVQIGPHASKVKFLNTK